jgi:hypothetical protein
MRQDKKQGKETVKYTVSNQHGASGQQAPHSAKARYSHTIIITLHYIIIIIVVIITITL